MMADKLMFEELESFLQACASYKAWIDCGKDLVKHPELLDAYDQDLDAFAKSICTTRRWAFAYVWETVTNGGIIR